MKSNFAEEDLIRLAVCFIIAVSLNKCTVLGSLRCEREQSSLINQETVVDCTITGGYYGVYWYIGETRDSIIRYINGHKAGSEYQSGKLDIAPNGSMIIKNTSVEDEKTYRVMVVWREGGDDSAYVNLLVIVPSSRDIPEIDQCNDSGICRLCLYRPQLLKCSIDGRPPVDLKWFDESSEILPGDKNVTESFYSTTFISSSIVNIHLDSPEIKAIVCAPSGPAVILHEGAVKNASVLLITPSNPYHTSKETYYFSASNSSIEIGQNSSNTVAWIKQTTNIDFSLKAPRCKTLDWLESGKLNLRLYTDYEGIYTQVVKKNGDTFARNVYEVLRATAPTQSHFIEECLSQDSKSCSIYVNDSGMLTCSLNSTRPAGSIMWNVTESGLLVNLVSSFAACENGLCSTFATIKFYFKANAQTAVAELECIVNGPWNGFPLSSTVQVYNNQYFTTPISSTPTFSATELTNTQAAESETRDNASKKERTHWAVPFLLVMVFILFGVVIVLVLILNKYRAGKCCKSNLNERREDKAKVSPSFRLS